jgi:hypothetical protein
MSKMFKYIYIIFLIVFLNNSFSQDNYEKSSSFEGLHFLIGYIENEFYVIDPSRNKELKIFISTKDDSNIEIKFPNQGAEYFSLPADSVMVMEIPPYIESTESEEITDKLVEIKSDVPVTVYAFSSQPRTSDSYAAIPIANWGKEYYVMSFPNDQYTLDKPPAHKQDSIRLLTPRSSEFLVVSAYDNTKVNITPKVLTRGGMQANQTYEVTLNKGECYMVQSFPVSANRGDLSGSKITADKPIGVISGHQRASVPIGLNPQFDTKDHLVEMITPAESWGNTYISVPFNISPEGDLFRVMGKEQGTIISRKNSQNEIQYDLNDDDYMYEFRGITEPTIWNANKPVQIAQFMMRTNNETRNDLYDPSMVMLSPAEQFVSRVIFHTPGNVFNNPEQYIEHYVTVIAQKEALPHITLNEELLDTTTNLTSSRIVGSDYYWTQIKLTAGTHKLESKTGRFSGILFGNGKYDSYAMILGASLTNPKYEDSLAPVVDYDVDCWQINATATDDNNVSASGIYYAFVRDNETFNFNYSISPINPNDSVISFTATPKDIFQDGVIVFEIYDKSGNMEKFTYRHNAVMLEVPDEFTYDAVDWQDSVCFEYTIKNSGVDDIQLLDIVLNADSRVSLEFAGDLPEILENNEEFTFKLCINPKGDSTLISGNIDILFDCGIEYSYPVDVGFSAPALIAEDYNFGDILVGEDSCTVLEIINIGNEPIIIESISETGDTDKFNYDASIFHATIEKGDTLELEVCFSPERLGDFELVINYNNNFNLQKQSVLKGRGIAPNVENVTIDLGNIRIGDTKDTTLILKNDGNADVSLFFKGFASQSATDNISAMLEAIDNVDINVNEEYRADFSFSPVNTNSYSQIAEYTTNWDNHSDIVVEIKAQGTIPVIDISDVDFGNVVIYNDTSATFEIINSSGNEPLYIRDAYLISENSTYFDYDLSVLNDTTINVGESFEIPVSFNPQEIGQFEAVIGIRNDSYPNYEIKTDTLYIRGNSTPFLSPELSFSESHDDFYYCQTGLIELIVTNEEILPVDITDIQLVDNNDGFSEFAGDLPELPLKLDAGDNFKLVLNALAERPEIIDLSIIVETFGINKDTFNIEIQPLAESLIINDISDIVSEPGDTVNITFSGLIPYFTEIQGVLEFEIDVPSNFWHLVENNYLIEINGTILESYPVDVFQEYEKIIVRTMPLLFKETADWSFTLKFLSLLSSENDREITLNAYYNKCYTNTSKNFMSKIEGVCAFDLRIPQISSNFTEVKISPNPTSEILNFEVFVKENQKFNISLFDMSGRNIKLEEGIIVKTGNNIFQYPIGRLSNGLYILSLKNENVNKNLIIVVNK